MCAVSAVVVKMQACHHQTTTTTTTKLFASEISNNNKKTVVETIKKTKCEATAVVVFDNQSLFLPICLTIHHYMHAHTQQLLSLSGRRDFQNWHLTVEWIFSLTKDSPNRSSSHTQFFVGKRSLFLWCTSCWHLYRRALLEVVMVGHACFG